MPLGPDDLVFCTAPVSQRDLIGMLEPIRQAGFAGLSITPGMVFALQARGATLADIRARIADAGLQVAEVDCIGCWLPGQGPAPHVDPDLSGLLTQLTPERMLPMAAALGARSVSVVEIFGVPVETGPAAEAFAAICDQARDYGLLVHIEFIPAGGVGDLETAAEIVRRADRPNGGLTIDALHLARGGAQVCDLMAIAPEHIMAVQLCDGPRTPPANLAAEMMGGRLLPGEGELGVVELVRALDRIGSTAPIGVEVFSSAVTDQPTTALAQAWAKAARRVIGQARPGRDHKGDSQ
jgi:sugar phosphate isomerase/epimerase